MRTGIILAILCFTLLMAGCVRSLHPLYTDKDLTFMTGLIGSWTEESGSKDTWIFQQSGETSYDLIHTQKGAPARFEAHLVKLDKYLFLDLFPDQPDTKNDFYKSHLIPAHTFSRIWIEGDVIRLALFDNDWLKEMIAKKAVTIQHERIEDGIILTARTEDLQKLVLTYANDEQAFPKPSELHRRK